MSGAILSVALAMIASYGIAIVRLETVRAEPVEAQARRFDRLSANGLWHPEISRRLNAIAYHTVDSTRCWVYAYLFAKQDRANILPDELLEFRKVAAAYARLKALA